jgi:hypothetical protein
MALTVDDLIELAPDVVDLVREVSEDLLRDDDGRVRLTKEEAKRIRAQIFRLAAHFAQQAID